MAAIDKRRCPATNDTCLAIVSIVGAIVVGVIHVCTTSAAIHVATVGIIIVFTSIDHCMVGIIIGYVLTLVDTDGTTVNHDRSIVISVTVLATAVNRTSDRRLCVACPAGCGSDGHFCIIHPRHFVVYRAWRSDVTTRCTVHHAIIHAIGTDGAARDGDCRLAT